MPTCRILQGDAFAMLRTLPDESVHTCVTSPPYYLQRDYKVEGQIGMEKTWQDHLQVLVALFSEVHRVLRKDGTLWLNYGDCYASAPNGRSAKDSKEIGGDDRTFRDKPGSTVGNGMKPKDLMMLPSRLAIALHDAGWWVRSEIIWHKKSAMPSSVKDRPGNSYEKIFLLSKSEHYFYDHMAIREKCTSGDPNSPRGSKGTSTKNAGRRNIEQAQERYGDNMTASRLLATSRAGTPLETRNLRDVWSLSHEQNKEDHYASFPSEVARRCILLSTSEVGCCPKCGKGWKRIVEAQGGSIGQDWRPDRSTEAEQGKKIVDRRAKGGHGYRVESVGWKAGCKCRQSIEKNVPAVVLDPFCGSGTTGAVAATYGRSFVGIELSPKYVDISRRKIDTIINQTVLPLFQADSVSTSQVIQTSMFDDELVLEEVA